MLEANKKSVEGEFDTMQQLATTLGMYEEALSEGEWAGVLRHHIMSS